MSTYKLWVAGGKLPYRTPALPRHALHQRVASLLYRIARTLPSLSKVRDNLSCRQIDVLVIDLGLDTLLPFSLGVTNTCYENT